MATFPLFTTTVLEFVFHPEKSCQPFVLLWDPGGACWRRKKGVACNSVSVYTAMMTGLGCGQHVQNYYSFPSEVVMSFKDPLSLKWQTMVFSLFVQGRSPCVIRQGGPFQPLSCLARCPEVLYLFLFLCMSVMLTRRLQSLPIFPQGLPKSAERVKSEARCLSRARYATGEHSFQ